MLPQLRHRILACWKLKAILAATVGFTFCVAYLLIGNFPLFPVRELPLTRLDRAIGFHPDVWVWIYQSEYLIVNVIPWFAERRDQLLRYLRGFALLSLISFTVFVLFPIRAPKPHVADLQGMYWLLQLYDVPNNSLPSLHAGMIVFTLAFGNRVIGREIPRAIKLLALTWGALILYATLATKEHYAVDIVTGVLLGIAVHLWTWRWPRCVDQDAPQHGPDIPPRVEIMVGPADGIDLARQSE
jgi:membrane-associated phospholipid phosphatase